MKKEFKLRPYQKEAADAATDTDLKRVLLVLSTGMGKSYIIAELGRRNIDKRILVFQPNKEILEQNVEKFITATGKEPAILSASAKSWEVGHITFSTIGTAKNKIEELKKQQIDMIILDEAQEYPVNSEDSMITKILDELNFQGKVIGLTATPFITYNGEVKDSGWNKAKTKRYMTRPMHLEVLTNGGPALLGKKSFWEDILYNTSPVDSFDKGFLVKPNYRLFRAPALDSASKLLKVGLGGQSYTEKSIEAFDKYMINVYKAYAKKIQERHKRSIVFVRTIEVAEKLAKEIKNSYAISTNTKRKKREEIIQKFKNDSDEHIVVFNVSVLGRGFDSPNCEAIAFFTPTRSLIRYMQFIGRCLRPDPNNPDKEAYVYDFDLTDQRGDTRSTIKRFGKVEDIFLRKDLDGVWRIYGKPNKQFRQISGFQGDTTVWYVPRWLKPKK